MHRAMQLTSSSFLSFSTAILRLQSLQVPQLPTTSRRTHSLSNLLQPSRLRRGDLPNPSRGSSPRPSSGPRTRRTRLERQLVQTRSDSQPSDPSRTRRSTSLRLQRRLGRGLLVRESDPEGGRETRRRDDGRRMDAATRPGSVEVLGRWERQGEVLDVSKI